MTKSLVSFDLDDTLIDTSDVVFKAFNDTLREKGKSPISKDKYEKINFWSGDSRAALQSLGIDESPKQFLEQYDILFKQATEEYIENGEIRKFPNTQTVISDFGDKFDARAIVTNSPHEVAMLKLTELNLERFFDHIVTPKHVDEKKPSPEGIRRVIEESGANENSTVHIGDSSHDLEAAKKAGVISVILGSNDAEADYRVSELGELSELSGKLKRS
ncbi:MAG: HAD family hydrolase [Candidatus Nanohalobium sp.]